ncbi:ankyrin repeat-containing domain protein, partial [Delphinella strobiligena]
YGSGLQAAAYSQKIGIVQMLLDQGADVNVQGGHYGNALQAACATHRANGKTVEMLLDRGADVNAQGGVHGTALCAASRTYSIEAVRILLDRGAEMNAQDTE